MRQDAVTDRQFAAAVFTALLSPLVRVLPRAAAVSAGRWAWLCVLPAIPVFAALALLLRSLGRGLGPGEGMAALFPRVFGRTLGRALLVLYAGWFLFYAGFVLRSGGERLAAATYPHSGPTLFILLTLGMALLASLGTLRAAVRMGAALRIALLAVLWAVFLLSLRNIEPQNLVPLPRDGAAGLLRGALPAATVGGAAALFSFLWGSVSPTPRGKRAFYMHFGMLAATALLLCLTAVGSFGALLTARLTYPFFTMIRDLSLSGKAVRFEAAVLALWVSADLVMCALTLRCAHEALRTALRLPPPEKADGSLRRLREGRWLLFLEAGLALICAFFLPASAAAFRRWAEELVPLMMDVFVFGGFLILWAAGKLGKKL